MTDNTENIKKLCEHICFLYNNELFSDLTLKFSNALCKNRIHVHSFVLLMKSPNFYSTLKRGCDKFVHIDLATYDTILEFIKHLYIGKCSININNIPDILQISKKYEVQSLEIECSAWIEEHIQIETACYLLELANTCNAIIFKEAVIDFIEDNFLDVIKSDSFKKTNKSIVMEILELDDINASEVEICRELLNWGSSECARVGLDLSKKRQCLDDIIKLIRFPTMSNEDFCRIIKDEPDILTSNEIISIFMSIGISEDNAFGFNIHPRKDTKHKLFNYNVESPYLIDLWKDEGSENTKIPSFKSIFSVNKPIALIKIGCSGTEKNELVKVQILRVDNNDIMCESYGVVPGDRIDLIVLDRPIRIRANIKYEIGLVYLDACSNFWYCDEEKAKFQTVNEVEFQFDELSPMIYQIVFKTL